MKDTGINSQKFDQNDTERRLNESSTQTGKYDNSQSGQAKTDVHNKSNDRS
jgi:hypothetical protein